MRICGVCNPPVSRKADVLSWAAAACFCLGLTDRIDGEVSIGYLFGRAPKVSIGYLLGRALKVSI